jgi:hypothetical protein
MLFARVGTNIFSDVGCFLNFSVACEVVIAKKNRFIKLVLSLGFASFQLAEN